MQRYARWRLHGCSTASNAVVVMKVLNGFRCRGMPKAECIRHHSGYDLVRMTHRTVVASQGCALGPTQRTPGARGKWCTWGV